MVISKKPGSYRMNKKIVLLFCMLIVSVGSLSGCLELGGGNTDEIVSDVKLLYSNDNETVLVYVGTTSAKTIANTIDNLIDNGYVYIGSYTTRRDNSWYSNEAYLIFRLNYNNSCKI